MEIYVMVSAAHSGRILKVVRPSEEVVCRSYSASVVVRLVAFLLSRISRLTTTRPDHVESASTSNKELPSYMVHT